MSKIIINGNSCQIQEEKDIEFLRSLDKALSFKVIGAEFSPAYKGYYTSNGFVKWDGMKRILTEKLQFPIGLLDRVLKIYKDNNKEVFVKDNRPSEIISEPIDIVSKLTSLNRTPYFYQLEVVKATEQNERGIIRAATSAGKTICSALITARFNRPTNIYVISSDLLSQFHKLYSSLFDEKIGFIGDGVCDIQRINIVSIWTAGAALGLKKSEIAIEIDSEEREEKKSKKDKLTSKEISEQKYIDIIKCIKSAEVVLIDECHMSAATTIQKIHKTSVSARRVYGFSGTPWRDDGADLLIESVLGKYIYEIRAKFLIDNGFIAKPVIKFVKTPPYPEKLPKSYPTVYSQYIVENPDRNNLVLKHAKELVKKGYKVLVLFNKIKHGEILFDMLSKELSCALLSGKDSLETRDNVKKEFVNGNIQVILASKIFDIGVDIPEISGLIIASGGKSSVSCLQRIGRAIRKSPGKKQAAIIDFFDQAHYVSDHSKARYKIMKYEEFEIFFSNG